MFNQAIRVFDWTLLIILFACFCYQAIFFFTRFFKNKKPPLAPEEKNYAVLIAARNEENVIADLIDNIHSQNYNQKKLTVYVVADNCTDKTAEIARAHGAVCYERFNKIQVGKCYALQYLFQRLAACGDDQKFDGYFIFDADNLLDSDFVCEMNKKFCQGYTAVAGYRNSKNLTDNWISYGYGLWFLHEAGFLNRGRDMVGSNAMISGTGYLISADIIREHGGWDWFLLTEDIEFTASCFCKGKKIGFCETAVYYDEQPVNFRESFSQRLRWVKGYYQVFANYGLKLFGKCVKEHSFSCLDMIMTYVPALVLSLAMFLGYAVFIVIGLITGQDLHWAVYCTVMAFVKTYIGIGALGVYTIITEHHHVHGDWLKQILYLLLFPAFMFTYYPIALAAMRTRNVQWTTIHHGAKRGKYAEKSQTTRA